MHINLIKADFEYIESYLKSLSSGMDYEYFMLSEFRDKIDEQEKRRLVVLSSHLKENERLYRYNESHYAITEKGKQVLNYGVEKYFTEKAQDQEKERQQKDKPLISVSGNAIVGDNNTGVIQGSDLGNSRFNNSSIILANDINIPQPTQEAKTILRNKESIWTKIYKWTDHKTISIIIGTILGFLATKLITWLGF